MGAEKIVKIGIENENDILKERVNLLESVIDYSVAEQLQQLKISCETLNEQNKHLISIDSEKDKRIVDLNSQLSYLKNNIQQQLDIQKHRLEMQFDSNKKQSLMDQRKNIRSKEIKPVVEKVQQITEDRNRIKEMYDSLVGLHKQQLDKIESLTVIINNIFNTVNDNNTKLISLLDNNASKEEIKSAVVQNTTDLKIKNECIRINELLSDGHTQTEIAALLYPGLSRGKQKVTERINSTTYINLFNTIK